MISQFLPKENDTGDVPSPSPHDWKLAVIEHFFSMFLCPVNSVFHDKWRLAICQ